MKKHFKRIMPDHKKIRDQKALRIFGKVLYEPNLWHLNRYSVARAFSVGLFCAWVPVPFQMVIAAALAIVVRSNLPLAVALVWLTNPITMPPLFFFAYKLGSWLLSTPPQPFHFELTIDWLIQTLSGNWQPFLLGCFVCGVVSAILSNLIIRMLWRYFTIRSWHQRKMMRKVKKAKKHK